ncbi:MAG TPA: hypothetical protein VGS27_21710 [Candidatus Sulfotelmatobacter sp.]|nr:hypothetical protein [Candidatus Sulfotelmatobacter sp.]
MTLIDQCKERAVRVLSKIDRVERMSPGSHWLKPQRTCADIVIRLDEPLEPSELFQIGNWLIDAEASIDPFLYPLNEDLCWQCGHAQPDVEKRITPPANNGKRYHAYICGECWKRQPRDMSTCFIGVEEEAPHA